MINESTAVGFKHAIRAVTATIIALIFIAALLFLLFGGYAAIGGYTLLAERRCFLQLRFFRDYDNFAGGTHAHSLISIICLFFKISLPGFDSTLMLDTVFRNKSADSASWGSAFRKMRRRRSVSYSSSPIMAYSASAWAFIR